MLQMLYAPRKVKIRGHVGLHSVRYVFEGRALQKVPKDDFSRIAVVISSLHSLTQAVPGFLLVHSFSVPHLSWLLPQPKSHAELIQAPKQIAEVKVINIDLRIGIQSKPKMADALTEKQRGLVDELEEIAQIVRVDYWNILQRERGSRTAVLEVMKRELIRGEVIGQYTLIDDLLSTELCKYFLPGKNLIAQWKTKRFRRFSYYLIERLYLTQKLAFLKDLYTVPKQIARNIEELNALRNAMAHAFFPENLRAYQMKGRPAPGKPIVVHYKGQDIFSILRVSTSSWMIARKFLRS